MIYLILALWIVSAFIILWERNMVRMIVWLGLSSFIAAFAFLLLGSPDVAMAEAAISAFTTVFFVICFEKYYGLRNVPDLLNKDGEEGKRNYVKLIPAAAFTVFLFGLFVYFIPDNYFNTYLKDLYITRFNQDVGGYNAVTSIYLGYRVYDTLFEALMLVIAVVAVIHMSHFSEISVKEGKHSEMEKSHMALFLLRIAAPLTVLFGIYLIANGFITAGGGFQGGLALAGFFVCRYMIYDIYDVPIKKINKMEEIVFAAITILAALIIFQSAIEDLPYQIVPLFQNIYLVVMNGLIGAKVACGFIILFYRYVAIERN